MPLNHKKVFLTKNYLNELERRINWYTSRHMYVMIDMHQDVYGAAVGGHGAPDWACRTNGAAPICLPGEHLGG
ncbi:MAG: cellulase family glycosylhydrolase [Saprospirales bacterium]|nr:cellulase family glycosylhydrolase [Saprospirales bacterium]